MVKSALRQVYGFSMLAALTALTIAFQPTTLPAADNVIDWTKQFGSPTDDYVEGAATDSAGNVYVAGLTYGALPGGGGSQGGTDTFVIKYDASGNVLWNRQFETASNDSASGAATDSAGNVYVVGHTNGALPGGGSHGLLDGFVRKYDASGNITSTKQFGTPLADYGRGAATDLSGRVYVAGFTYGALAGGVGSQGGADAYVMKFRVALAAYYVTPNPFSPDFDGVQDAQGFVFSLTKSAHVTIRVSNYKGVVRTVYVQPFIKSGVIYNKYLGPGLHTVGWTGTDDTGRVLPAGNYKYEIIARNGTETASGTGIAAITPVSSASK